MIDSGDQQQPGPAGCIRAARAAVAEVIERLNVPTEENGGRCGDLLVEVERQLQSAAGLLRQVEDPRNPGLRHDVERLRIEIRTLARTLAESDRLVSGWVRRLGIRTGGYTEQGAAAPLVLIKKVNIAG